MTIVSTLLRRRWLGPVAVLAVALIFRFWALGRPDTLVFDEVYYVRDAISQLAHGYPTVWPDREPSLAGGRATEFSESAANAVHPPLGKWLIGLGILIFGADTGWGWRSAVALAGVLTVALTMRLAWSMSRSLVTTCLAGLLLAIDGVHVTLSRVGLLDGLLTCAIVAGALCIWHDHLRDRTRSWWMRPWLVGGAACFGAASAIKWSGIYPLVFFFVFIAVSDVLVSRRTGSRHPWFGAAGRTIATGVGALIVALTTYVASWIGWISPRAAMRATALPPGGRHCGGTTWRCSSGIERCRHRTPTTRRRGPGLSGSFRRRCTAPPSPLPEQRPVPMQRIGCPWSHRFRICS